MESENKNNKDDLSLLEINKKINENKIRNSTCLSSIDTNSEIYKRQQFFDFNEDNVKLYYSKTLDK